MAHVSVRLRLRPRHIILSEGDLGGEAGLPQGDVRPQQSAGEGESQFCAERTVPERHCGRGRSVGTEVQQAFTHAGDGFYARFSRGGDGLEYTDMSAGV